VESEGGKEETGRGKGERGGREAYHFLLLSNHMRYFGCLQKRELFLHVIVDEGKPKQFLKLYLVM